MKLLVLAVGRPRAPLAEAVAEYERRAARYFSLDTVEVKEQTSRRAESPAAVMKEEGDRLLARLPAGMELVALDREGSRWSSEDLARYLGELQVRSSPGAAFVIGGAFGLAPEVTTRADRLLSLSDFTMPHELARVVLAEQLYRAGTILRGEPYHKSADR